MPRIRAIPVLVLAQALMALREEWSRLPDPDRARLGEILREARTHRTLSARDRDDLRRIAGSIDKGALAKAVISARGHGRRGRFF